jgi:hypothetical protein
MPHSITTQKTTVNKTCEIIMTILGMLNEKFYSPLKSAYKTNYIKLTT